MYNILTVQVYNSHFQKDILTTLYFVHVFSKFEKTKYVFNDISFRKHAVKWRRSANSEYNYFKRVLL